MPHQNDAAYLQRVDESEMESDEEGLLYTRLLHSRIGVQWDVGRIDSDLWGAHRKRQAGV